LEVISVKLKELTPFGVRVKQRLIELRMTQKEFCIKYDIPTNRFSEILYNVRPGTKYKRLIADVLDIREAA
jgi:hypothetical protein